MAYAFRDSDPAARRLEVVADVFAPATRALLGEVRCLLGAGSAPRGLDLGCAHGRTTLLLAEGLGCAHVLGVDASEAFLARAKRRGDPRLAFHRGDVTAPPFPGAPFDVAFCRFLLSHLADPAAALAAWAGQLAPGGLLVVQEVEWIRTPPGPLRRYLAIVDAMLRARGQVLDVGPRLQAAPDPPGLARAQSARRELPVTSADAARMFSLNLEAWGEDPAVVARHGRPELRALGAALAQLREAGGPRAGEGEPLWALRELVWRRASEEAA